MEAFPIVLGKVWSIQYVAAMTTSIKCKDRIKRSQSEEERKMPSLELESCFESREVARVEQYRMVKILVMIKIQVVLKSLHIWTAKNFRKRTSLNHVWITTTLLNRISLNGYENSDRSRPTKIVSLSVPTPRANERHIPRRKKRRARNR